MFCKIHCQAIKLIKWLVNEIGHPLLSFKLISSQGNLINKWDAKSLLEEENICVTKFSEIIKQTDLM